MPIYPSQPDQKGKVLLLEGVNDSAVELFENSTYLSVERLPKALDGAALREAPVLTNDARRDVPSTVICTGAPSDQVKAWAEKGYPPMAGESPACRNSGRWREYRERRRNS